MWKVTSDLFNWWEVNRKLSMSNFDFIRDDKLYSKSAIRDDKLYSKSAIKYDARVAAWERVADGIDDLNRGGYYRRPQSLEEPSLESSSSR